MTNEEEIVTWHERFLCYKLMLIILFCLPVVANSAENTLSAAVSLQQDFNDNYLMSSANPQSLWGKYLKPSLEYRYSNSAEIFSVSVQGSLERFDRSEFDGEYPALKLTFKKMLERSSFSVDYTANLQSTRMPEFNDSGNFEKVVSDKNTSSVKALWQIELNPQSSISISGSHQLVNYESETYADLKNDGFQGNWNYQITERISAYVGTSLTQYESEYASNFPIVPLLLQGYLLCPPNSVLLSQYACKSFSPIQGNAVTNTNSKALQAGFTWDIHEHIKFSSGAGTASSETAQYIDVPEMPVEFGQPINEKVVFGGARQIVSDSKTRLANIGLEYKRESSSLDLTAESSMQPNSSGTLWKSESVRLKAMYSFSEVAWLSTSLSYIKLRSLDENVISASSDRDIWGGQLKYGYRITPTLITAFSIGYRHQIEYANTELGANAMLGAFSIDYTPKE